jgi:hypothetical protein
MAFSFNHAAQRPACGPASPSPLFLFLPVAASWGPHVRVAPTFRPLPCLALPRLPRRPSAVTASVPRSFHLQAINQGAFVLRFHFPSINSIRYFSIKSFPPS